MNFLAGIPRCNPSPALFLETLAAIEASTRRPQALLIIDNGDTALELPCVDGVAVSLVRPSQNIGCAGAWNKICAWANDRDVPVIILNDDCAVAPDTFEQMLVAPTPSFICARGFSCFRIDPALWRRVGPFDEAFYPAYYEDTDYRRRLSLLDIPLVEWSVKEVETLAPGRTRTPSGIVHGKHAANGSYQGWAGEKLAWFKSCLEMNKQRYIDKWGGGPGNETFHWPFNKFE